MSASSDNKSFAYSPVLNFIQMNIKEGIDDGIIIKHTVDFFENSIISFAKIIFYAVAVPSEIFPKRVGNKAVASNLRDIVDSFYQCDSEEIAVPIYVIRLPVEVPVIPAVAYSRLATKLNKIGQTPEAVNAKLTTYKLNFPQLPTPTARTMEAQATVVISNVPKILDNPTKRREMIEKIQGYQAISSMRHSRDKLAVTIDDIAADVFYKAVPSALANSKVKLIEKK